MIVNPKDRLLPDAIGPYLFTHTFGQRIYYYPEVDSTNRVAMELARAGEPEGTVVYTDYQTAGRGRADHTWHSVGGRDLLFSVILRPKADLRFVLPVTLALSVAISVCLTKILDMDTHVKWPNDVVTSKGKIGGILAETVTSSPSDGFVVVGVGINVQSQPDDFPAGLRDRAVSCKSLTGEEFDRAWVFSDILGTMESYYQRFRAEGFGPLVTTYEDRMLLTGATVTFEHEGENVVGRVDGVNADGALRVELNESRRTVELYNAELTVIK